VRLSERAVRAIVLEYLPRLGIDPAQWRVRVTVHAKPDDCTDEGQRDSEAFTRVSGAYMHATIWVNAWQIKSRRHLRWVLAHECAHLATDELACIVRDRLGDTLAERPTEQLTERIARLLAPETAELWRTDPVR